MPQADHESVVLRFRDGRTLRGLLTSDFSPRETEFKIETEDGEVASISLFELKAVFFPKDPKQRSADMAMAGVERDVPGSALARVEFFDGEIIRGRVQHYSVANAGFFLFPTATETNNDRIFVVATALTTVAIEG